MSWKLYGNTIIGDNTQSLLGTNVSMNSEGNIIAITENNNNLSIVRVYKLLLNIWTQIGQNLESNIVSDNFGNDLHLSGDGNTLAIGSKSKDINGETNIGSVICYRFDDNLWQQIGSELIGTNSLDFFGTNISLSNDGNVLVVGYYNQNIIGEIYGCVKTFRYSEPTNSWIQMGNIIKGNSASSFSGISVSLNYNGSYLVVGYLYNTTDVSSSQTGQVVIYYWNYDLQDWNILGEPINGETPFEHFGASVDISDDGFTIVSGAPNYNLKTGLAKVFTWNGELWTQKGQIINGQNSSEFGFCVSMSGDSNTIAIGAINSKKKGYTQVFRFINTVWNLIGDTLTGEFNDDRDGYKVRLSNNGNRIIISAPYYDNSLISNVGRVKVYEYIENPPPICLSHNTVVLTDRGYRQISSLKNNDTILTEDNRKVKIIRILKSTLTNGKLYIIPAHYFDNKYPPNNVILTGSHLIKYNKKWYAPITLKNLELYTKDYNVYNIELDYIRDNLVVNSGCIVESYCNMNNPTHKAEYYKRINNKNQT